MHIILPGTGLQLMNGFPENPSGQEHVCIWFTTIQVAWAPHVPGHGSEHLLLMHALSLGHSWLSTHSGRQPANGLPWNSGRQVHTPLLHCALYPQGDGLHGSLAGGGDAEWRT